MILQRALLKLHRAGIAFGPFHRMLEHRVWRVERGEAAGLKLSFPQNLDFVRGSSEPPTQRCIVENLRSGGVFYDVGANVGFFSLLAARCVGRAGVVYAFEPVAKNAATIRRNARLNGFDSVSVFEVAVDARDGNAELFLTEWDGGASLCESSVSPTGGARRTHVRVVSLDELIETERLRPPTLVKIDVEGAELGVVKGMVRTIAKFKPMIIYELDDGDRGSFLRRWDELDRFVVALGYRVAHLEDAYPHTPWHVGHSLALPG